MKWNVLIKILSSILFYIIEKKLCNKQRGAGICVNFHLMGASIFIDWTIFTYLIDLIGLHEIADSFNSYSISYDISLKL